MGAHYTSDGLLKLVTKLQTFIGSTQALVATGSLDIGDVKTTIADLTPAAQSLDDLRADLHSLAGSLRRTARIILVVGDLGQTTGAPADPATFIAKCRPEDLDYMVALRKAQRGDMVEFYLRCRAEALGFDSDIGDEVDNGLNDPGTPGNQEPPKPYDYR